MDYERINDKPQNGIISPSKLRMKLMGVSPQRKKDGANCNSSRTSPSRLQDPDFLNNSLLASQSHHNEDFDDTVSSLEPVSVNSCGQTVQNQHQSVQVKAQQASRADSGNSSSCVINPDENLDYDSNASSSSFEFHKGERMGHNRSLARSLSRPTSYKWNDAEKWIMNKQLGQGNYPRSQNFHSTGNRMLGMNMVRVAPEGAGFDHRLPLRAPETKRVDFSNAVQSNGANAPIDLFPQSKDLNEVGNVKDSTNDVAGTPGIRAISMRDMGTEMTPVPSQEPSRTATPVGATTPLRSPTSSIPSTPRGGEPATSLDTSDTKARSMTEKSSKELSEEELKLKTRREIVALGVQLGKMNIAAWASKADKEKNPSQTTDPEELEHIEFEKRAAAWEEAEKSKHAARYKREEIKIQAWENQQKAKLEEELRKIEGKVERLRTESQAKMVKKIAIARKQSEQKRAAAEATKKRQAEKTAAQVEYIRQTGQIPSSDYTCCGLFS